MYQSFKNFWFDIYPPTNFDKFPLYLGKILTFTENVNFILMENKNERKFSLDILSSIAKEHLENRLFGLEFRSNTNAE